MTDDDLLQRSCKRRCEKKHAIVAWSRGVVDSARRVRSADESWMNVWINLGSQSAALLNTVGLGSTEASRLTILAASNQSQVRI